MRRPPPRGRIPRPVSALARAAILVLLAGAMHFPHAEMADTEGGITLFLAGDLMTGRGIDQVLAHPGDPVLHEPWVKDARHYVSLAERVNGPIPRPADCSYLWGDALDELQRMAPALRLINLETSITTSNDPWPHKGIHYRMHPANAGCLATASIDVVSLANNHVLDWSHAGLAETLDTLAGVGVTTVGAGRDLATASAPAIRKVPGPGRVLVFAWGVRDSGIPRNWAASPGAPGVRLTELSQRSAERIAAEIREQRQPGDVVIASFHWGDNWGHDIPAEQIRFAHTLIDSGAVDLIHGHSSHHPKAIEVYRGRLVLYGAGDLLNDYEGIGGHESFRSGLTLMYFPTLDPATGRLVRMRLIPMVIRRFSLHRAAMDDARWLGETLGRESARFGVRVRLDPDGGLSLE